MNRNALLSACDRGNAWRMAVGILFAGESDTPSFNAVINSSEWRLALDLFTSMASRRLRRSAVGCGACLDAVGHGRQWRQALSKSLLHENDQGCFNAAVSACERACRASRDASQVRRKERQRQGMSLCSLRLNLAAPPANGRFPPEAERELSFSSRRQVNRHFAAPLGLVALCFSLSPGAGRWRRKDAGGSGASTACDV